MCDNYLITNMQNIYIKLIHLSRETEKLNKEFQFLINKLNPFLLLINNYKFLIND